MIILVKALASVLFMCFYRKRCPENPKLQFRDEG